MPKISIITANWNCAKFLKGMIKSVRKQKFSDYEHLILDDCSTDKSRRVLTKLSDGDKRIRLIFANKKLRCGSSYAQLADAAKGDIIGVLDSDDCLCSDAMQTIVNLYDKYPEVGYIWSQYWLCNEGLHRIKKGVSSHPGNRTLVEAGMAGKHCFSHWRTFRRSLIKDVGSSVIFKEGLKSAVDKYMGYALEELSVGGFIDVPLYKYRQRSMGNLSYTGRKNWKKIKKSFDAKRKNGSIIVYPIKVLEIN